jgi:hypothetical protein
MALPLLKELKKVALSAIIQGLFCRMHYSCVLLMLSPSFWKTLVCFDPLGFQLT